MKIFELLEGGMKVGIVAFFPLKKDTGALIPLFLSIFVNYHEGKLNAEQ